MHYRFAVAAFSVAIVGWSPVVESSPDSAALEERQRSRPKACEPGPSNSAPDPRLSPLSLEEFRALGGDPAKLVTLRFPLPADEFASELASLVKVIAAKLASTGELKWANGTPDHRQAKLLLRCIETWQHPEFRQPLLAVLRRDERHRIHAAESLLRYDESALRAEVERFRDFEHTEHQTCCIVSTWTVEQLLRDPKLTKRGVSFEEHEGLLPPLQGFGSRVAWPVGLSFDTALEGLGSTNRSIRLQSWAWLAGKGIIAPTETVEEAWPRLNPQQRQFIVRSFDKYGGQSPYVGVERLRTLFEALLRRGGKALSLRVRCELISSLGVLRSNYARRFARQTIARGLPWITPEGDLRSQDWLLYYSIGSLAASPRAEDIPCLLRLSESGNRDVRRFAWRGLAVAEHPRVFRRLRRAIVEAEWDEVSYAAKAMERTGRLRTELRWEYLGIFAEALATRELDWSSVDLVDHFSGVAGVDFGFNGRRLPSGFDENAARSASDRCLSWYAENKPAGRARPDRRDDGQ